ncbi:MAG: hypothetical protein NTX59_00775 [Elusimicrobia bacterium]|nr:hypothetical protein [Elusimicrobiota bacterium]
MKKAMMMIVVLGLSGGAYAAEDAIKAGNLENVRNQFAPIISGQVVMVPEPVAKQLGMDGVEMRTTAPEPEPGQIHFLIPTQELCGELNVTGASGLLGVVGRAKQILAGQGVDVSHVAVDGWGIIYMTTSAEVKENVFDEKNAPITLGERATQERMVKKIKELLKSGAVITSCGVYLEPRYGNAPDFLPVSIIPQRHSFRVEYIQ